MSAEALAGELHLPLFIIRLEGLITRYMGDTAAKLRLIFDETSKRRGVYLFDEFDAVGGGLLDHFGVHAIAVLEAVRNMEVCFEAGKAEGGLEDDN